MFETASNTGEISSFQSQMLLRTWSGQSSNVTRSTHCGSNQAQSPQLTGNGCQALKLGSCMPKAPALLMLLQGRRERLCASWFMHARMSTPTVTIAWSPLNVALVFSWPASCPLCDCSPSPGANVYQSALSICAGAFYQNRIQGLRVCLVSLTVTKNSLAM